MQLNVDGVLNRTGVKGLYVASDGVYPKSPCMQCPLKHTSKEYESPSGLVLILRYVLKDVACKENADTYRHMLDTILHYCTAQDSIISMHTSTEEIFERAHACDGVW